VEDLLASPITFGGLASGLDTKSIIAALVSVEGQKVTLLQDQQSGFKDQITAYDSLLAKLTTLQTALTKISDPTQFNAFATHVSAGGDAYLSATTQGTVHAGSYQVAVQTLAQSSYMRSDGFADANASLGLTGTLTLQVGSTTTDVTVDSSDDSLFGIRDAIRASGAAVDASVIFDGTQYHLELRGRDTGVKNAVTVTAQPGATNPGGPLLNLSQIRAASDAAFQIDGQNYSSASNTVTGAIEGVTLQLQNAQAAGDPPINLSVSPSTDVIQQQIQDFVDAYNGVMGFLNDQSAPRASSSDPVKPLSGESALTSLRLSFGSVLTSATNFPTAYQSFASIGITSENDGTLSFDTSKFQSAIGADVDGVNKLLTDPTQGLAGKLLAAVKVRTDAVNGTVHLREDSIHEQISNLDDRIKDAQDALDSYQQSLVTKFAAYETLIGQLKSQGDALSAFAVSLPNANGSGSSSSGG
jgi:flagellar hook-associated protein 2